jgi:RHS repeat-associated protein
VKEGSTTVATFEYDGAGRRTEKVAAGLTHQYIYDVEDIVEERITGSSSDTIRYFHGAGIDEPLARTNGSSVTTYYLADHLGSIVQETNASGAVTLEREYGPWGDLLSGASTAGYGFQGREWDAEVALYYFRARYYNAASGTWASDDPIGLTGGVNFSQFVDNNPVRFVDPFGLCSSEDEQQQEHPLDRRYRELAQRKKPTILDEATPEIARRAQHMGTPDTYTQLTVTMLLIEYFAVESASELALDLGLDFAVAHPTAFEVISELTQSLPPVAPVGVIQHVSYAAQQTSWFSKLSDIVMTFIAK